MRLKSQEGYMPRVAGRDGWEGPKAAHVKGLGSKDWTSRSPSIHFTSFFLLTMYLLSSTPHNARPLWKHAVRANFVLRALISYPNMLLHILAPIQHTSPNDNASMAWYPSKAGSFASHMPGSGFSRTSSCPIFSIAEVDSSKSAIAVHSNSANNPAKPPPKSDKAKRSFLLPSPSWRT
ncbi:uncharacterized protein MYCFIDRAFT_177611 [Pseudocercospora fijiensis CIRAD86]|uniref:Uncharacterized protein n=1 Tax=Pseudocercospora fijiensis (strain CIRAD86) TaxID=383855 RepID=M2ZNK9_PSEFD|nr:uncharacterized protein MYCFIDRAFT_177611 [Pseudocercospora fijiensis CIRAD86]EME80679.1 hypothetical protein MYCFIDRAFT_177611 [Pseudocercospora fijiensis CIRAD86]